MPVLVKYSIINSGFSVYAGPQVSWLLDTKTEAKNGNEIDLDNGFYKAEFSGIVGSEFNIPRTSFLVSARYQFGLSDIEKADNGNRSPIKNNAATFTIGYRF